MHREWEYLAIAPDDLARRLDEPVVVIGDGADSIDSPFARRVQPPRRGPAPAVVGSLGHSRLARGNTVAAADLAPIYLRPSEAELKRRRGAAVS
jgi:tRNA threonylcarbamoyladenosine biosynthesis protein TsaB